MKVERTVLDIGSHWGYFCNELEKAGYQCTAVEADVSNYYFLDKLKKASGSRFESICGSVFDVVDGTKHYDVVLALNIFHHFLKTEEKYEMLKALLGRLDANEMFLQTHNPEEPQMEGAYKNYDGKSFADFVANSMGFSNVELLKEYENGRMMFKLSKV